MKGTLHKTESGWHVINMQATLNGPLLHSLPLIDNGHIDGLMLYDSNEGQEVEFEIIDFPVPPTNGRVSNSFSKYAKLVDKATRPVTEDDAWPKYPEVKIICPRCKALMPCTCNANWDDVWKAFYMAEKQVPEGARRLIIDVWLTENYNPPTKKQD